MLDDLASSIIEDKPAEPVSHEMGIWIELFEDPFAASDHLRIVHLRERRLAHERLGGHFVAAELQPDPLSHVGDMGVDRPGRAHVVEIVPRHRRELVIHEIVRRGDIFNARQCRNAGDGVGHAERLEEALGHEIVPGLGGDCAARSARPRESKCSDSRTDCGNSMTASNGAAAS